MPRTPEVAVHEQLRPVATVVETEGFGLALVLILVQVLLVLIHNLSEDVAESGEPAHVGIGMHNIVFIRKMSIPV